MAKTKSTSRRAPAKKARPQARRKSASGSSRSTKPENKNGSMLEQFFVDALKDIYWAEKALTKALPRMAKAATSEELKGAFQDHLKVTEKQIGRLEQVFQKLGKKAQGKKCEAMAGLVAESEDIISETKSDTSTRDAALIISAQKVEHYEIASYGGLVQLAKTMRKPDLAKILEVTLKEEKETDALLTGLAEQGGVNEEASEEAPDKSIKDNIMSIFS